VVGDPNVSSFEQMKSIVPFCYLLHNYLKWLKEVPGCLEFYRGLNIKDEQRQNFMKGSVKFQAFTSTSRNRNLAEIYGNTLLIIDMDRRVGDDPSQSRILCGRDVSDISNFPEEEEVLIWPSRRFEF
jgi:hypothetical protein